MKQVRQATAGNVASLPAAAAALRPSIRPVMEWYGRTTRDMGYPSMRRHPPRPRKKLSTHV